MTISDDSSESTVAIDPAVHSPEEIGSVRMDVINVLRGFCMGAADTVPGVSGGTVALILGHYHRLVGAISRVDSTLVKLAFSGNVSAAAKHLDFRFLATLGFGIALGIVTLSGAMHWLLDHRMPQTLAVFLGLMVASVWIVKGYINRWSPQCIVGMLLGAVAAVAITMIPMGNGNMSLPYLFLSASVAICAMILPGISGAFVLLLFGVYHNVTGLIKDAAKGNISLDSITQILVFCGGCLFGLLAFSRLLKWLLEHHRDVTMATLIGLMIGSLRKLWPLQMPTAETANEKLKFRVMEFVSPSDWDTAAGSFPVLIGLAVAAAVVVLVAEKVAVKE
ncbi:hypothetical protein Pla22_34890 [Rubripirellula amarantea]|uniref:DUF368 domain-containing protein n=1 Tax=Rubripirellula amarantea TaxID=2527999 RepID=A0A5C5WIU3_9BACT|nr:DUF368 domain-containing protein [Rubripirellula amarantea]TWT50746.1 hypothetical protein Pla22_34890 [Rubripirellula amarantea]